MLPPPPQIFHGRESELEEVVQILVQDSPRIVILGAGGIGKTSLAIAALHNSQIGAKYSRLYFVSCHSSPGCAELVSAIAKHVGVAKGSGQSGKLVTYFTHSPPSLLILDNFETPWEAASSRCEVEEFLALLADIPHLALLVSVIIIRL
jgi:hypothetical protein